MLNRSVHFAFFVWACRRVDVKRRLQRRQSCDRCLAMQLREKIASRGSDIEPMPSRAYHRLPNGYIGVSPVSTSPTAVATFDYVKTPPTPPTPPTAALTPGFTSPIFTETIPTPPVGARLHELDAEQRHVCYPSSSPQRLQHFDDVEQRHVPCPPSPCPDNVEHRHLTYPPPTPRGLQYRFDDSEDEEPTPPTPPPKPEYRERVNRPPLPRINIERHQWPRPWEVRKDSNLGAPSRAYSISSYYYSNRNEF